MPEELSTLSEGEGWSAVIVSPWHSLTEKGLSHA